LTVASSLRSAGPFVGNGVTVAFPFAFRVFQASDLQITYTNAAGISNVLLSGFTVSLNVDQVATPGGTITYPSSGSPMGVLESLNVQGGLAYVQSTSLANASHYFPQVIENALDYLTMLIQQALATIGRALTFPLGETPASLPPLATRAGRYLAFDSLGNPIAANTITGAATRTTQLITATAGQTVVPVANAYVIATNAIDIYLNGVRLSPADYTETNTTSFTVALPLVLGDELFVASLLPLTYGSATVVAPYTPTGIGAITTTAQLALQATIKRPEENGAVGDGVTDDTAAIQRAIAALEATGSNLLTLELSSKPYLVLGTLTITKAIHVVGQGVFDLENARPLTRPPDGTWLIHGSTTGPLFQISSPTSHACLLERFGVFQLGHAAPAPGWTPTVRDFVIRAENSTGAVKIKDVHFHNVYNGVLCDNIARPQIENITGQFFKNAFTFNRIYDIGKLDGLHAWTFWSEDTNVLQWTQANGVSVLLQRVDGLWMDRIFAFAQTIVVLINTSPNALGGARVINIGGLYADFCGRALVIDNPVTHVTINSLFHLGQVWPVSPVAALPNAAGIDIVSGNNSLVQVGNYYGVLTPAYSVRVNGTSNQVWIESCIIEQFDKGATGAAAFTIAATNSVYLGPNPTQITAAGATGPYVAGGGTLRKTLAQIVLAGSDANNVVTAAAGAGQLSVVTTEGEANAGLAVLAKGTGIVQIAAAANALSFYGGASAVKGAVTGAKAGNVALASLITYLAARGLLTDSST
jgi:hypothetical protein